MTVEEVRLQDEERIVAELSQLGIRYLSHQSFDALLVRPPQVILADLMAQPSSRVRVAIIALLLAKPGYAVHVPSALDRLEDEEALLLKLFYSAAVCLQKKYSTILGSFLGESWQALPDLFANELGLSGQTVDEKLNKLAQIHAQKTEIKLNWAGTYENAARHLLRHWELELLWKS